MKMSRKKEYFKYVTINLILGFIFSGAVLTYSQNTGLIGFIDATAISGVLLVTIGWFFFIDNHNVLDIITYGVKSFAKGAFGKKMKNSYIEHIEGKTKIKSSIYLSLWFASIPFFITSGILTIIYYS